MNCAEPTIARELKIGNTRIKIATDYCKDRSKEEVEAILGRIAENAQRAISAGKIKEAEYGREAS